MARSTPFASLGTTEKWSSSSAEFTFKLKELTRFIL